METQIQVHDFFLVLAVILISAKIFGEIFAYFKIPPVIGEVFAGILIGPSFLGIVEPNLILKILAEIGIILLLFEVGLDTDMDKLKEAGLKAVIIAISGAFFPFLFGLLVSYYIFNLPIVVSLFIGGALTATSIGITIRALKDIGKHKTQIAQIVLGAAVVDDILGVILLITIYDFVITGQVNIYNLLRMLALIGLFFALAPILAKFLSKAIYLYDKKFSRSDGFVITAIISLILIFAYLSHFFNAPEILGAFTAGIALSRRFFLPFGIAFQTDPDFLNRIESYLKPISHLFVPIFFVMVGVSINLKAIDLTSPTLWSIGALLLIISIVGKVLGSFIVKNISMLKRIIIGTAMVPRGEVGLIFAELGRTTEILKVDIYAVLVFVIIITTVISPILLKWLFKFEKD